MVPARVWRPWRLAAVAAIAPEITAVSPAGMWMARKARNTGPVPATARLNPLPPAAACRPVAMRAPVAVMPAMTVIPSPLFAWPGGSGGAPGRGRPGGCGGRGDAEQPPGWPGQPPVRGAEHGGQGGHQQGADHG